MNVKIVNEAGQAVGHVNGSMMEVLDQIEVIPTYSFQTCNTLKCCIN